MKISNCFIIIISIISIIKNIDYIDRYNGYDGVFDCLGNGTNIDEDGVFNDPETCFKNRPRTKWNCCYFEYYNETSEKYQKGCMRYRKNNISDLNDLKYYITKLSEDNVLNCRQNYLISSFILLFTLFLFFL